MCFVQVLEGLVVCGKVDRAGKRAAHFQKYLGSAVDSISRVWMLSSFYLNECMCVFVNPCVVFFVCVWGGVLKLLCMVWSHANVVVFWLRDECACRSCDLGVGTLESKRGHLKPGSDGIAV